MAIIPIRDVPGNPVQPSGNELILIDNGIAMQKATINDAVEPKATEIVDDKIADLELGTAAQADISDFATAAQGDLADTAVQPGDLATVATSGDYNDLSNLPTLGTAAAMDATAFATAAQGALADSAVQPGDLATVATTGAYSDLTGLPTLGTAAAQDVGAFATAAQGALADSAVQPGDLATVATTGSYADLSNKPLTNPPGGLAGQVLTKQSSTDGDYIWDTPAGTGDMLKSVYDPQNVEGDVFDGGNLHDRTITISKTAWVYADRAALAGANVPPSALRVFVQFYDATNVAAGGGAWYRRLDSVPGTVEAWNVISNGGAVAWILDEAEITPAMLGAVGDGVADDTAALQASLDSALPLNWGDSSHVYRTTDKLAADLTSPMCWRSSGASIVLDSPSSVEAVLDITISNNGFNSHIGKLLIDCQKKAFVGFSCISAITGVPTDQFPDLVIEDLHVRRAYRADKTFAVGDGILVGRAFNKLILKRPDVRDVSEAVGADEFGSVGVTGITIARNNSTGDCAQQIVIEDCYVEDIYSEDPAVDYDQDGLRIFTNYPQNTTSPGEPTVIIRGGTIKNSRNRSIKLQTQWAVIDGLKIIKNSSIDIGSAGLTRSDDIDVQVGACSISNLEVYYSIFGGNGIVRATTSAAGELNHLCHLQLSNVKVVLFSTPVIDSLFTSWPSSGNQRYIAQATNVQVMGNGNYRVEHFWTARRSTTSIGYRAHLMLTNCAAALGTAFVKIDNSGASGRLAASLVACHHTRPATTVPAFDIAPESNDDFQTTVCYGLT